MLLTAVLDDGKHVHHPPCTGYMVVERDDHALPAYELEFECKGWQDDECGLPWYPSRPVKYHPELKPNPNHTSQAATKHAADVARLSPAPYGSSARPEVGSARRSSHRPRGSRRYWRGEQGGEGEDRGCYGHGSTREDVAAAPAVLWLCYPPV